MQTFRFGVLAFIMATSLGCATTRDRSGVVIDPAGVDMNLYQQDLAACRQIAEQVEQRAAGGVVGGAVVGGVLGAILGDSSTAQRGAGAGAVTGGLGGAGSTQQERQVVIKNCLRNKGYKVLN